MNPLWQFSIEYYKRPGVEPACMAWQDRFGGDVNVLLLCLWCATAGIRLTESDLRRLLAQPLLCRWREQVVQPLRQVRRSSKEADPVASAGESVALLRDELYRGLLGAELRAEQVEQHLLWRWLEAADLLRCAQVDAPCVMALARHNLFSYSGILSIEGPTCGLFDDLCDALAVSG